MENSSYIVDAALDQAVGTKIKTLRAAQGVTLDDLAASSGVSRAMISRIERGEASPTASLLSRLCAALGQSMSSFFAEEQADPSPLSRYDVQPVWQDPETGYRRRAVSPVAGSGMKIDLVEVELPPDTRVFFPPHDAGKAMPQYVWLLEGQLEMTVGDEVYRMAPGDCLFMTIGQGHSFRNPGLSPARYAVILDRGRPYSGR